MSKVDTADSDKNLKFLIERFETHHSHTCDRIESICQDAQFLRANMADILQTVAIIRQILETTGSATGTDLANHLIEALEGLADDLNSLRECYELRQHLRHLENDFSLCHDEVRRPERLMNINIELVRLLWDKCKKNSLEKLVQFMESVTYIEWHSGTESDRGIKVENWLDNLRVMEDSIDSDLGELRLASLKESTSRFSSLVDKYSTAADQHLEDIIAKLCDQVSQYVGRISK